ncbi:hypothetical protein AGABI1DRAFT_116179 [Agaricus bisporus var. burnettii JB137-S8]|uniref:Uncharacterized protein n=1 Tax=Agaricus bisporus var. burnettii (strain JB137-S8 / ATCC MYA-4627 / FGSC 10392) TaxID=597362 RepID=K5WYL7_AGABU|nr:uncharacterized protein AGABI1DRAFT_116179 [Agaricus bisporus var. burnettii JB137-S8]EKM75697.1 hypothetical protein AGABI1DRAFT_116179 [Agaricus bisporus var. burnettii JB137-S8]
MISKQWGCRILGAWTDPGGVLGGEILRTGLRWNVIVLHRMHIRASCSKAPVKYFDFETAN